MAQIGLSNLYYAPITEGVNGVESFGTPVKLAKMISADISIDSDNAILWADDGADVVMKEFTGGTISLNVNDLGDSVAAALLGARVDGKGVLVSAAEDVPPPVAIGFQSKSAKGGDRYFWFYRVTFGLPSTNLNTKGESVEFATPTIEGTISRTNKTDSTGKHPWKYEAKGGEADDTVTSTWFNAVKWPYSGGTPGLATLTFSAGALIPATFNPDTLNYLLSLAASTTTVSWTSTSAVAATINGSSFANGDSVSASVGNNPMVITCTDSDNQKNYFINVYRSE